MAVTPDQVYGDPEWTHAQPGFSLQFSQLLKQYGIVPDQATLSRYGLGDFFNADDAAAAQQNPYSIAAQLKNTLSGNLTNNATSANSHGALFSGAFKNMQDASGRDYTKNYALAGDQELSGLLGIMQDREGVYNSVYGRLLAQPPAATADTTPNTVPGIGSLPVGAPIGTGTNYPIPQGPYQRTGPEAGSVAKKPKPVVGGMGHVT